MSVDIANPYLRTKVMTASPEELRLMLVEGCIRFMRQGRDALERKDYETQFEALSNAKNIIIELMTTMRHEIAPDLCSRLDALYTYMFKQLTDGGFDRDSTKIDEVIDLMDYERETWVMLMDKLARERSNAPSSPPAGTERAGCRAPLSIEG